MGLYAPIVLITVTQGDFLNYEAWRPKLLRACAAAALMCAVSISATGVAAAQTPQPEAAGRSQAYDDAFAAMSADLSDPSKSFAFVKAAIAAGDVLGAISTLERILQIDPSLDNIRLELGLLQIQVGRPEFGNMLIEQALRNTAIPSEVRARAEATAGRAALAGRRDRFAGRVYIGVQHDENPNAAPDEVQVVGIGSTGQIVEIGFGGAALSEQAESQWSAVVSASGEYSHDLGFQNPIELVAAGQLFANKYEDRTDIEAVVASVQAGPRFTLGSDKAGAVLLMPYIGATLFQLDGDKYYQSGSVGVKTDTYVSRQTYLSGALQAEFRDYENSPPTRPFAHDQTGTYITAGFGVRHALSSDWEVSASLSGEAVSAKGKPQRSSGFIIVPAAPDYQDRKRLDVDLGVARTIPALFGQSPLPWRMEAAVSYRTTQYDKADPAISLNQARDEDQIGASLALAAPLTDLLALQARVQYINNDSNIPNFSYDNTAFSLGLSARF